VGKRVGEMGEKGRANGGEKGIDKGVEKGEV
jgi:hypothetical protein